MQNKLQLTDREIALAMEGLSEYIWRWRAQHPDVAEEMRALYEKLSDYADYQRSGFSAIVK